ncbi:MAG: SLBB domain-containing protein [Spirochaetota bacterium]
MSSFAAILLLVCGHMTGAQQSGDSSSTAAAAGPASESARRIIHLDQYRPTPGDVYDLTINYGFDPAFGTGESAQSEGTRRTETLRVIIRSDHELDVPYAGTIDTSALTFSELQEVVTSRVRERLLVPYVSLTLAAPAVFDVFVWGQVESPGYHTMTSLDRLDDVLRIAGGTNAAGSRRRVEIHRNDEIAPHDLVAFVAMGREGENPFLRPGDRVFVPALESSVEIRGGVARPGRYEILEDEVIGRVIELAGGLLPTSRPDEATVTRLTESGSYATLDPAGIDLPDLNVRAGDIISIPTSVPATATVLVEGAVHRGPVEETGARSIPTEPILLEVSYAPGMTVLRVLERFGGPTSFAELDRAFIIRGTDNRREPIPDLETLWLERQWDRDIDIAPGDRLVVPMRRLVVNVGGFVNRPGTFPFTSGYSAGDYLELAGGIDVENGSADQVFFVRPNGTRTRVSVDTAVPTGTMIYVDRNGWSRTRATFADIVTVTGWITSIVGATVVIFEFIQLFDPEFP